SDGGFTIVTPDPLPNVSVNFGGVVYRDVNANGLEDPGEALLAGFTVYIDSNNNGKLDAGEPARVSAEEGRYGFGEFPDGEFVVRVLLGGPRMTHAYGSDGYVFDPDVQVNMQLHFGITFVSLVAPVPMTHDLYGEWPNPDPDTAFIRGL